MGKKLAIEHHLIRPNEVIKLLEMMGGKNTDNADGCSFLYYTICTPIINNPNNEKVICGFTNLKMQNDHFTIFTLEKFWKKYPYKLNDFVLCNDGLLGVITKMEWDYEKSDMKYHVSFKESYYNKWYSSKNIQCKFMEAKGKKLAILGHKTRGKEVIELLEMMGGKTNCDSTGDNLGLCYLIDDENDIVRQSVAYIDYEDGELNIFTLEEFLERFPYKVGDKAVYEDDNDIVVISEIKWDDTVGDIFYNVKRIDEDDCFLCPPELLKPYKETDMNENKFGTAKEPLKPKSNAVKLVDGKVIDNLRKEFCERCGSQRCSGQDDELEYCERFKKLLEENKFPSFEPMFKMNDELEYKIPDGYEISEVSKDTVFIKPIKPKYPTTYDECVEIMGVDLWNTLWGESATEYEEQTEKLINTLIKLKVCRDAYWKIAGEEMGLGKPWKPDWNDEIQKYCIRTDRNKIVNCSSSFNNRILAFPTMEMRDAFYENFKDLIESCKELL